MFIVDIALLT